MDERLKRNAENIEKKLALRILRPFEYWEILQPWAAYSIKCLMGASKARRIDPEADVKIIQEESVVSYGACGIPYVVGVVYPILYQ